MTERARPTLRCLREDLALPVPTVDTPLDEIAHPLVSKAAERFADSQTPQERIAAIDDHVLFKIKVQRWRGAVWVDAGLPWLVAAGALAKLRYSPSRELSVAGGCGTMAATGRDRATGTHNGQMHINLA